MEAKLRFRAILNEYGHRIIHGQPDFIVDAVNAAGGTCYFLRTRVLLRVDGSKLTKSWFGMTQDDISASPKYTQIYRRKSLDFQGFNFHTFTDSIEEPADTIFHLLDRMDQFEASGLRPSVINMRGHNNM